MTNNEIRAALESKLRRGATYSDQDLTPFALGVEWAQEREHEDAARYRLAKTLEGQVVVMETLKSRGAEALDQALDDLMAEDADARNEAGYAA